MKLKKCLNIVPTISWQCVIYDSHKFDSKTKYFYSVKVTFERNWQNNKNWSFSLDRTFSGRKNSCGQMGWQKESHNGQWLWSSVHRVCLLLWRSEFESRENLHFYSINYLKRTKNIQKEAVDATKKAPKIDVLDVSP